MSIISLARGGAGVVRHPVQHLQQLGAHPGRVHVPGGHASDGAAGRLADPPAAEAHAARPGDGRRRRRASRSRSPGAAVGAPASSMATMEQAQAASTDGAIIRLDGVCKRFGEPRGAARHRHGDAEGRGRLRDRPLRLRQVDAPPLHQPAGAAERRPDLPGGQGDHRQGRQGGRRLRAARRVGMVFQSFNLFPHKCALDNVEPRAAEGARTPREGGARRRRRSSWSGSGSPTSSASTRTASPAASSSGWRSPARWRWTRT